MRHSSSGPWGCPACEVAQASRQRPHCTHENIIRLMSRGCRRIGQLRSQALPEGEAGVRQSRQSRARSRSNATTMPFGLAIHTRLWNSPTAQPKRQNRWRAKANSAENTSVPMPMKRAWPGVSVPASRPRHSSAGGSR